MAVVVVRDAVRDDAAAIVRVRARTWQSAYAHVFPQQALEAMSSESSISRADGVVARRHRERASEITRADRRCIGRGRRLRPPRGDARRSGRLGTLVREVRYRISLEPAA
ncbi:MAG: hypothetical protein A2Y55_01760 [Actinobacteria bacterium RBG_16_68_12]|nr:MAG: hypothetical protein A2Y55_01760 [Actinobacteria bacterium RBG_16_68_12]